MTVSYEDADLADGPIGGGQILGYSDLPGPMADVVPAFKIGSSIPISFFDI